MSNIRRLVRRRGLMGILAMIAVLSAANLLTEGVDFAEWRSDWRPALRKSSGIPRLVSVELLPAMDGEMCQWVPASGVSLRALLHQQRLETEAASREASYLDASSLKGENPAEVHKRKPVRMIRDPYPAFSGIAVDPTRNEVVMTDESLFQIMVYDRQADTPPTAKMTEPKRVIGGLKSRINYQCGIYIDPATGDFYTAGTDNDYLLVFNNQAKGDVAPLRVLETSHGASGIVADEKSQEIIISHDTDHAVVTFRKTAEGSDPPIRLLQGDRTLLANPSGIALDTKNDIIFVANLGTVALLRRDPNLSVGRRREEEKPNWPLTYTHQVPGTGKHHPPSITSYARTASGDTPPLRVIQGPKTQMDWPSGLAVDPERGELYVADDTANSVLVFDASATGDVAPVRVIKGPRSLINSPTDVFVDLVNDELWVANFGSHSATVYKRTANGDVPPLRVIRSAPLDAGRPRMGNPHPLAFDTKREEILVPN